LRFSQPAVVGQAGRFQFQPIGPVSGGWYSLEVAIQDTLAVEDKERVGSLNVVSQRMETSPDESERFPAGAGMTVCVWRHYKSPDGLFEAQFPPGRIGNGLSRAAYGESSLHRRVIWLGDENDGSVTWMDVPEEFLQDRGEEALLAEALAQIPGESPTTNSVQYLDYNGLQLSATRPRKAPAAHGLWSMAGSTADYGVLNLRAIATSGFA
jgi:hypothetical protein